MAKLLRFKDILEMDGQSPLDQKPLSFNDMHSTEYRPGEDELTNYRAYRRKRAYGVGTGEGGYVGESVDAVEALNVQQRMARSRMIKRIKNKLSLGRRRAKMKMADKGKLEKRAQKTARKLIVKKITKEIPKEKLSMARKAEIEKRLDKPAVKARIKMLAKRLL
jgi:hypothetical protein